MKPSRIQLVLALVAALLATPAVVTLGDEADDQFAVAAGHYAARRWQLSAEEFQKFLTNYPEHDKRTKALFYCGEALVQCSKLREAKVCFVAVLDSEAAKSSTPTPHRYTRQALFRAGECALLTGAVEEAQSLLSKFHDEFGDDALNAYALSYLGEIALKAGDAGRAKAAYREAVERFPEGPKADDCRLGLAQAHLRLKEFDEAETLLLRAAKRNDLAVAANYWLGQVYKAEEKWDRAASAFQAAMSADAPKANLEALRYQAAESLYRAEKFQDAIEVLRAGVADQGGQSLPPEHRYVLALAQQGLGRHEEALETLRGLDGEPDRQLVANVQLATASSLLALGRHRDAIEPLKQFLSTTSGVDATNRSRALVQLALAYGRIRDFDQAQATLEELNAADGRLAAVTSLELARLAVSAKEATSAGSFFQNATREGADIETGSAALLAWAQWSAEQGEAEKAISLYHRLTTDFPKSAHVPAAIYGWAWCLEDSNRKEEANEKFEEIRQHYSASEYWPDATYRLALFAAQRNQTARATKLLDELIAQADEAGEKVRPETLLYALYLRAQVAIAEKQWDHAERDLDRLRRDGGASPLALPAEFLLADVAYRRGDFDKAASRFGELEPKLDGRQDAWIPMVALRRAQILAQQKRWSEARAVAEQIANDYPNFDQQYEADYVIGRSLAADANLAEARQWYQKVVKSRQGGKTETAAMAQWMIGETYFLQEDYATAVREYLRVEVLYAYPHWQAAALLQAGKCYEQTADRTNAAEAYTRLLERYSQTPFTAEARERLKNLATRTAESKNRQPSVTR